MKIHIISHTLPPMLDGIGDYTANLAIEFSRYHSVSILTAVGVDASPIASVNIVPLFDPAHPKTFWTILEYVKEHEPDWLILQYCCWGYGKHGMNLQLPEVMHQIKKRFPNVRIGFMVHETYVWHETLKLAIMSTWQRWQLWRIGQSSDVVFFSIEYWANEHKSWFPTTKVIHLPVGSNINVVQISRQEARRRLDIAEGTLVLGLFGNAKTADMVKLLAETAKALIADGQDIKILYIGKDGETIKNGIGDAPLIDLGPLDAEEVSQSIAAVDIYLSAFIDGISTRRGSFMAGLQHGRAIVGTIGYLTDTVLKDASGTAYLASEAGDSKQFIEHVRALSKDRESRNHLEEQASALYENSFDWPKITQTMSRELLASS